jgi:hypothetical protein
MTTNERILTIKENCAGDDYTAIDAVKEWANCREAEIDDKGDVWIADPQRGHWLDEAAKAELIAWCEAQ